jgi:excisionase family DNA binding protein
VSAQHSSTTKLDIVRHSSVAFGMSKGISENPESVLHRQGLMTRSDHPVLGRVWLTPADVQEITGFGRTEVYAALQTGELEGHQRGKGRLWRIHRDAVDVWIRGEQQTA